MFNPTLYLTRRTNAQGKLVWAVIYKGQPTCADTTEERAKEVYTANVKQLRLKQDPDLAPCWNGDCGEWHTELAYA